MSARCKPHGRNIQAPRSKRGVLLSIGRQAAYS